MSQCEELMRPWECYAKHGKRFSSSCHLLLVTWPWFVIFHIFSMFQSCRWIRVCLATWANRCLTLWLYILTCAKDWVTACYEGMPFPLAWEPKPWGGNKRKWYEDGSKFKAFASKDGHHVSYFSISSIRFWGTQCLNMFDHVWPIYIYNSTMLGIITIQAIWAGPDSWWLQQRRGNPKAVHLIRVSGGPIVGAHFWVLPSGNQTCAGKSPIYPIYR